MGQRRAPLPKIPSLPTMMSLLLLRQKMSEKSWVIAPERSC